MMGSIYTGANGLKTHTTGMNIVGNNIANSNTIAFKQQNYLFQELMYKDLALGTSNGTVSNQVGVGSVSASIRPLFSEGPYESTTSYTDIAINGKGYFMVDAQNYDNTYLTRAGNFTFSKEGYLEDGNGSRLMGYAVNPTTGADVGTLSAIQLDFLGTTSPAVATTSISASFNLGFTTNLAESFETVTTSTPTDDDPDATTTVTNTVDPYFSMFSNYNANWSTPLSDSSYSQSITVYDSTGQAQSLTVHFDLATDSNGQKIMEYLVTMPVSDDNRSGMQLADGTYAEKAGILMAGTLSFNSSGQLTDMSAFTPTNGSDYSDLSNWTPAAIDSDGLPSFSLNAGNGSQTIGLNLGVTFPNGWSGGNITAAQVGTDGNLLPGTTAATNVIPTHTTAYSGSSSSVSSLSQNGNTEGFLNGIYYQEDGTIVGTFSNAQEIALARIPIFRVTSEDGLMLAGGNYYQITAASGALEEGVAGDENYGTVIGSYIEASNVDTAVQMVNMISLQRGFQSNSKVVSTTDEMLQKAIELKR